MKPAKLFVTLLSCGFVLLAFRGTVHGREMYEPVQNKAPLSIFKYPKVKPVADLKAGLTITRTGNGRLTIVGTVTNLGKSSCLTPSVAELMMNLGYAPHYSYAKTGVSEVLVSRSFNALGAGDSLKVSAVYQIPDFGGWASTDPDGNARRLFIFRVLKQDMSTYRPDEDGDIENNVADEVVIYRDLAH